MKNLIFYVSFFWLSIINSQDSIRTIFIDELKTNYNDFVIIEDNIYTITKGDSLVVWNYNNDSFKTLKKNINSIAKNSKNELLATTTDSTLLIKKKKWKKLNSFKGEAFNIFLDKENKPIVINNKGVFYKSKNFHPEKPSRIYKTRKRSDSINFYFSKPDVAFLDSKNRIWLTYDKGEWGAEVWFFDLNTKTFFEEEYLSINDHLSFQEEKEWNKKHNYKLVLRDSFPKKVKLINDKLLYKFPADIPIYNGVKGIAENDNGDIFISQSLNHFGVNGSIYSYYESEFEDFYREKEISILDYENEIIDEDGKAYKYKKNFLTEYLGPISYNKFNKSFYYYSNKGFFKITKNNTNYTKELIINPNLTWKGGLRHSVGYQMAVKKFEFIDAKRFVFLTNANGIGYFDGHQIKFYK